MRRRARALALIGVLAGAPAPAPGHVAPSARENNRYILLAPLGDRLRLVYTVYMGEEPGRRTRARMDRDRDGAISEAESAAWAAGLAADATASLSLEVDGRPVELRWAEVDVGLGDPGTGAGAFAVDLVAWACFERAREQTSHRIRFVDRLAIELPGETELRAEESPGVHITRTRLGAAPAGDRPRLEFKWRGGAGPAAAGFELDFTVEPALAAFSELPCPAGERPDQPRRTWPLLAAGGALVLVAALLLARRARRRTGS